MAFYETVNMSCQQIVCLYFESYPVYTAIFTTPDDIYEETLGIVGMGAMGQAVAKSAKKGFYNLLFFVRLSFFRHQGCPSSAKGLVQADQVGCYGPVTFGQLVLKRQ